MPKIRIVRKDFDVVFSPDKISRRPNSQIVIVKRQGEGIDEG
jgi:hypothetical protein